MKVLITGANGLLGQKLVLHAAFDPALEVIATAPSENRQYEWLTGYEFDHLDITDADQCRAVLQRHRPEVIIHTAAMTQVDACELDHDSCTKVNVEGTRNITEAAKGLTSRLVHLSTDFIFDGASGPYQEEDPPNPISFYGHSKLESEHIVRNSGLDFAIARTVLVYGVAHQMSRSNIVLWVKESLEQGKDIRVVTDQVRTPTLAEDLAAGCLLLAKTDQSGVFHVSGDLSLTPYEIAIRTASFFNLDLTLIAKADSSNFTQPARRPPVTGFNITKIHQLGYRPRSFEAGLAVVRDQLENPESAKSLFQ